MSDRDFRIPLRPSRSGNERAPQGTDGAEGRDRSPIGRLSGGRDPGTSSTVRFGVRPDRHNTPASGNSSGIGRGPPPAFGPVAHQSGLVASQGMPPHQQRPLAPSFQRGLDRAPTSSFGHSVRQPGHPGMPRQQVPANGGGHSAIRHPQAGQPPVQGRFCSQNASQPFQGRERTSHCAQPAADQRSMPSSFSSGRGHPSAQPAADQRSMPSSFSSGRGHPSTHSGPRNDQFRDSRSFGSDRGSSDRDQERSRSNYRSSNDGSRGRCFSQESAASGQSTERQFDRGGRGGWMGGRGSSSGGRGSWDGGRGGGRGRGSYGGGRGGGNFGPFSDQPVKDLCDLAPLEFDPNSSSGTVGTEIKIRSNFVACDVTKSWKIFMYHVTFDPMIESRRMKFGLMRSQKDVHGGTFVPDSTLYSSKEFTREGEEKTLIALLRPPRGCPDDASSPREVKITYRRVKTIDSHDEQAVTILTNLVKQSQRLLNLTQIRRHFLDLKALKHVPQHCLSLAPSYDVHLTARDAGLLMCVNVRSRPLRSDTVLDHLRRLYNEAKGDWSVYKKLSMESLLGQVVFTTYRHDTYEIGGIDWDKSVSSPFKEGSDKTVLDYFKEKYSEDPSAHIRDFNQPLLLAVPTAKSRRRAKVAEAQGVEAAPAQHQLHLVPELCRMTGLGASARQNRPLMEDLARIMRKDPNTRVADGRGFVSRFNGNPEVLRLCREDYNLEMARDLIEVKARHLGEPSLSIKDRRLHMHNATFNNCLKNNRAERPTDLLKWAVICPEKDFSITQTAVREIVQIGNELGMRIEEPARYEKVGDVRMVAYNEAIRNVVGHEYSAILAVVPDDDSTRYSGIKKKLMIDNAIPNQVAKVTTLRKGNKSISTKIAAQLLCKLGGAPWAVPTSTDGTLLIGFDLWREKKSRPVSAMVACLDQNNTKFFSRSFIENSPQGVSHHFEEGFSDCLRAYVKLNKRQPKRVVIFRSGASFGENDHIKEVEVNGVKRRYKEFLSADVKLGFVLVNRRTSVMFYAEQGSGKFGNVPAGTVIDSGVTEPGVKDFFLVPLSSGQGTVNPTYYRILEDSIPEFSMDTYQLMAFKQSHGYFNWTGAIRVPAVVQYATKLASLVGTHTMEPLHKELSDVLSFL